eukprot:symbB.v1.2.021846.t1/scaffold1913.1/size122320/2
MATEEWRQQWIEAVSKIRSDVSYDQSVKLNWEAKLDASKAIGFYRKIKSASIRHILMATPQDIALAKNRLDQGEAGLQLRGNFRSGGESFEQMPFCIRWWRSGSLSARRT